MADLLQDTIEVVVNNTSYEFAIPGYLDEIKLGIREKNIRRKIEEDLGGDLTGSAEGLDHYTYFLIRSAAQFEVLLRRSSDQWPWSADSNGKPIIDYTKWPKDKIDDAVAVSLAFRDRLARFRNGGLANGDAASEEAVASESDTKEVPIRPGDTRS